MTLISVETLNSVQHIDHSGPLAQVEHVVQYCLFMLN